MSKKNVRVRFAPSPTGPLHIGGVRTALFNYLFARKNNGTFILRIEDTDRERYVAGTEDYILESLKWCNIEIDEGVTAGGPFEPYRQSERKDIYLKYADILVEKGYAYYAFDTPEELDKLRKRFESENRTFTYDATVRLGLKNSLTLSSEEVTQLTEQGTPYVIRFRIPVRQNLVFHDVVRGEVSVDTSTLDDKVLLKADGMPTYHLANVVDDYLMEISHVIRGEEWLPSTPLHVLLYNAFGWEKEIPVFAHMPLTLRPDGKGKLSKREGDRLGFPVFPLQWTNPETGEVSRGYREEGYLPEAFINMLAFLGWNPGTDQEIFSLEELIEAFTLERIVKAGSRFDPEKARWFNHHYLVKKSNEDLAKHLQPELKRKNIHSGIEYITKAVALIKERAFLLTDLLEQSEFLFIPPAEYDTKVVKKIWKTDTSELILELRSVLFGIDEFITQNLEIKIKKFINEKGIGFGRIMNPLRLALVGSNWGPGLFDIMELLGKEEVIRRIDKCLNNPWSS